MLVRYKFKPIVRIKREGDYMLGLYVRLVVLALLVISAFAYAIFFHTPVRAVVSDTQVTGFAPSNVATGDTVDVLEASRVPKQAPSPVYGSGGNEGCGYWNSVAEQYVQSDEERAWIQKIMRCESSCNSRAYNASSGASGLVQIIPMYHPSVNPWDGDAAIQYALYKYRNGGAGLWECSYL